MNNKTSHSNLFLKTDDELIRILSHYWGISAEDLNKPFKVIATYKKASKKDVNGREYGYFEDVRNLNGDILYYPNKLGKVRVFSLHRDSFLTNEFWQVNVKFASRIQRTKFNNPFMLEISDTILGKPKLSFVDKLNKEKLIHKIFEETGSTSRDAKNISNALHAIMGDLYTETERFIFELLQNADDQPQEGSFVNVTLKTLKEDLLFLHSGKPFSEADVESISSIGDSTKKNDSEKTGYKGIGFKSVFSEAETVYINSGNFSFAFDKKSPVYYNEEDMDIIPWQIKPIWEEKYRLPKEVQEESLFFSAPVGIALNVESQNIIKYDKIITTLLSEPRFALFLRNIGNIRFESAKGDIIEIRKSINGNIVRVSSNEITEDWIIKDYIIPIPVETQEALQNEKLVPKKLKEATKTKITFAAKIVDGKVVPVQDAVLFTYLPTKVNDFGFKFLVNADFLTTASRESIHFKNIWNRFLFGKIGALLVDWVKSLAEYDGALRLLPKEKYDGENLLTLDFYNSFQKSASELDFIKGQNGNLATQDRIMIDRSDLSKIIGKDLFCSIIDSSRCLPYFDSDEDALKESKLYDSIYSVTTLTVLNAIYNNASFLNWFKDASEDSKASFYDWLINKDTEKRRESIVRVCDNLPVYKFSDKYYFENEIKATQIVVRKGHAKLVPLYKAIGLDCSTNIDELPIAKFYSDKSNKIVYSTFEYIFNHLRDNENFSKWLISAKVTETKILTDWLEEQDTSAQCHDIIVKFIESLPILVFNNETLKRSDIIRPYKKPIISNNRVVRYSDEEKLDETKIIITNKLSGVVALLSKIGFSCSNNIEESPFSKYFRHPKDIDVFNIICEKVKENKNTLNPLEKLTLFNTMKNLTGVGEVKLAQNLLFQNQAHTHRCWLSIMTAYSPNLPQWMYEYTICEEESFPELEPFLVKRDKIFDDIIKNKIDELRKVVPLKEIYLFYKDTWTPGFTKTLIDKYGITDDILEMVNEQDRESKRYLLLKVNNISLDLSKVYNSDDYNYKIIEIAFSIYNDEEIRSFADKIYVGERTVSSYTVSDNITFEYHEGKSLSIPLSKLLPEYEESGMTHKIKESLANFSDSNLEKLLCVKPMSSADAWKKCDKSKGYTPYSYLLGIYRTRKVYSYYNSYVPNINLSQVDEVWIHSLLDIMFEQNIELYNDSFGYRLSEYFRGFFKNEYVNEDEIILSSIESWADTEQKKSYLISLGVKTDLSNLIKFRKNLIENKPIEAIDIEKQKEQIVSTINYLKDKNKLPLKGENQVATLRQFVGYNRYLSVDVDLSILQEESTEYDLHEYCIWKKGNTISVFVYKGKMPKCLIKTNDNNLLLCTFNDGDYYYDASTRKLYISNDSEPRDILYNIVSENSIPFKAEDWQQLFYDNLVSKTEIEKKDKEIDELKSKLQKYIERYGNLRDTALSKDEVRSQENHVFGNNQELENSIESTNPEVINHGHDVDKDNLDEDERIDKNREAQYAAKDYLETKHEIDSSMWNPDEGSRIIKGKIKKNGQPVTVVITSSKNRKLYLHPWAFAELMVNPENILLNYGSDNQIHSLSYDDIFTDNPNVNLIFDIDIVTPKTMAELANKFMGTRNTCFVIENPKYSQSDEINSFGIHEKIDGEVKIDFSDDDIFNS